MNEIFLVLSPWIFMVLSILISANQREVNNFYNRVTFSLLGVSLMLNTLILILISKNVLIFSTIYLESALTENYFNFILIEAVLLVLFLIYPNIISNLRNSHSLDKVNLIYSMFGAALCGIFLTENILIISLFYIWSVISTYFFFFFGEFKKPASYIKYFKNSIVASLICLIIANIVALIYIKSLLISDIAKNLSDIPSFFRIIVIFGYILGFSFIAGIFPIFNLALSKFNKESNLGSFQLLNILVIPVSGLLIWCIIDMISPRNIIFGFILLSIAILGCIIAFLFIIRNVFCPKLKKAANILDMNGIMSIFGFHLFILIGGLQHIISSLEFEYISNIIFSLFIMLIFGGLFLITCYYPIFIDYKEYNINKIGALFSKYKFYGVIAIISPIILLFPFIFNRNIDFEYFTEFNSSNSLGTISKLSIYLALGIFMLFWIGMLINSGSIIAEIYFTPKNDSNFKHNEKIQKFSYFIHSTIVVIIIITFIFVPKSFIFQNLFI